MFKIKVFITTINYYSLLNKLPDYISPLGLGNSNFPPNWLNENSGDNISKLNKNYGELTGFYWVWKNLINNFSKEDFIGFCHYRKLWLNYLRSEKNFSKKSLNDYLLNKDNNIFYNYDAIQVQPINFKNRNLIEDFFLIHKNESLIKSLDFLKDPIRSNFYKYLNSNVLYPLNMFIVKKKYFEEYCNIIFPWLSKCYDYCLSNNLLEGYNLRLPAFLAERFTSFWFNQHISLKTTLSYARLGNFFLSEKVNKYFNPLKIPFTSKMYPTLHDY